MSSKRRPVAACLTVDAVCYQPCFQLRSVRRESDLFSAERKQCSVRNTLTTLSLRVHSHSDREESTCMNSHRHVLKHNVVRENTNCTFRGFQLFTSPETLHESTVREATGEKTRNAWSSSQKQGGFSLDSAFLFKKKQAVTQRATSDLMENLFFFS